MVPMNKVPTARIELLQN